MAYSLATVFHETAQTIQPIEEWGQGAGRPYGPSGYWGRGLVQLTWEGNYRTWSKRLGVDLVGHPDLALTWPVALPILIDGMQIGSFTGKRLMDFFNRSVDDPVNARRIINGTDKSLLISHYHITFLAALP